jgi:protein-S-isoprenylcysteine O-methyltransferase Ste14
MDDVLKFSTLLEYRIFGVAFGLLLLSELVIYIFTGRGNHKEGKENSDSGTVWMILIAWIGSIIISPYFRSKSVPVNLRNLLLPHSAYYFGIALIFFGVFIRCLAVWTLKKAFTHSVQTTQNQHLIQKGLYKIVRNPAYSGSILSLMGVAFVYRHVFVPICVLIICMFCYGVRIRVEEAALRGRFSEEFNEYCKRTRFRLIPYVY